MAVYIGYYRPVPSFAEANFARSRAEGFSPDPKMQQLVRELPERLPGSCRILAAYSPMAAAVFSETQPPGVLVVETDSTTDLTFINQHYAGYLLFQWAPATVVGTTRAEREAATQGALTPARAGV
jgi:hypothetical protein